MTEYSSIASALPTPARSLYRFVGDFADVYHPPINFRRFGQAVELDDLFACQLIQSRMPLVTEAIFQESGITEQELKQFPNAISHQRAPESFLLKKAWLMQALEEYRAALNSQSLS